MDRARWTLIAPLLAIPVIASGLQAPVITTQPSSVTVLQGQNATFTVAASGSAPLTYRWQQVWTGKGETQYENLINDSIHSGVTTATLTVTAATAPIFATTYRVVVSNGEGSAASKLVTMTVTPLQKPMFTTHPSTVSLAIGQNATFTVAASGTPVPTYQWQVSTNGGSTFSNVSNASPYSGATATTLTITAAGPDLNGYRYRAVATNSAGTAASVAATLTVKTVTPFAIFRPATGEVLNPGAAAQVLGAAGDIPIQGDFDGDGSLDAAVYRPSTGTWLVRGRSAVQWGLPGDIPVPADYTGDGVTDLAVFRQRDVIAEWWIFGEPVPRRFGLRGDIPVPADFDSDDLADLAVFRPATGTWYAMSSLVGVVGSARFGLAGDMPFVGHLDTDGDVDLAVFRPSTGYWHIAFAKGGTSTRQFGLPGDIPALDVALGVRLVPTLRVWRPATGVWYELSLLLGSVTSQQFGQPGDIPVLTRPGMALVRPGDIDGDHLADVAVYRPSSGEWLTRLSSTSYTTFATHNWGLPGDVPVRGDYDGDRRADAAVYRPSANAWYVALAADPLVRVWGISGDVPVPADYDGDGRTDMAVYRPATGQWWILTSASGFTGWFFTQWGLPGDAPLTGDFDGDGRTDPAVYRPSTGEWFVARSAGGFLTRQWGLPGDQPTARDFDGDGRADFAVFRPSTGQWFAIDANDGALIAIRQWGLNGDVPVAGDYDGDGLADLAVFRPSTQTWFIVRSSNGTVLQLQWGLPGDAPVVAR